MKPTIEHLARALNETEKSWRVRMLAELLPPGVDLFDDADVAQALFGAGLCSRHFTDILDDIIAFATVQRIADRLDRRGG